MNDTTLEIARALVLLVTIAVLFHHGRKWQGPRPRGWHLVTAGFTLILLCSLLQLTDNHWNGGLTAILVKSDAIAGVVAVITHVGGFALLGAGLLLWLPSIHNYPLALARQRHTQAELEASRAHLEQRVEEQTQALQAGNQALSQEIAERRQAESALRVSQQRLARAQHIGRMGSWEQNLTSGDLHLSAEATSLLGFSADHRPNRVQDLLAFVHPDDRRLVRKAFIDAIRSRQPLTLCHRVVRPDGEVLTLQQQAEVSVADAADALVLSGTIQDVTDSKHVEAVLRVHEAQLKQVQSMARIGVFVWNDVNDEPEYVTDELAAILGMSPEQYYEEHGSSERILELIHPEDREAYRRATDEATAKAQAYDIEFRMRDYHGAMRHWREIGEPLVDEDGTAVRTFGTLQDVTAFKQTESALKQSEQRIRGLLDNSPTSIVLKDRDGRFRLVNPQFLARHGFELDDVLGKTAWDLFPESFAAAQERLDQAVLSSGHTCEEELAVRLPDGRLHSIAMTRFPVFDDQHRVTGIGSIGLDVTEQRAAEERLRQAQKMEAVGQLTGGVAHDFNNILAVILGNGEILQERLGPENNQSQAICRAATRGAELTQRLLAFSRKQPLHPEAVDLHHLVSGLLDLLRRTLGETIVIEAVSSSGLWAADADPGQLENAVLNLALNARDAMPDGGVLRIESSNTQLNDARALGNFEVKPGDYVLLSVSDTGCGIEPQLLGRVFEPFFTTKEVGEGSGLGLSMVYGFVKQSGGHITIESETDHGTRVCLYLPRADRAADAPEMTIDQAAPPSASGETILVLEDDADVRALTTEILESLHYKVLEAEDGKSAMAVLEANRDIDLLLSDVVLPGGISGPELAKMAKRAHPDLKCLFMSGYNHVSTRPCAAAPLQADLISKPFRKKELAAKLRDVLGSAQP